MTFQNAGAELVTLPVDAQGICVERIEEICQKYPIRMLYVTSHHHYPTTVSLSAERRVLLLQLAEKFNFLILEDDYDYDFHYASRPILPLASADRQGLVVYVGSLCKTIAPAIRIGYVVAAQDLIEELGYLRRIIDRQGDPALEQAVAELFTEGDIKRHLKKTLKIYHRRRDFFCDLLQKELPNDLTWQMPEGGMALWAIFDHKIHLPNLAQKATELNFLLNDGKNHNPLNKQLNATRLGFASLNLEELEQSVALLKRLIYH
jgi:GntR family transcriptional regulator/MocR family aminotransferase